MSMQTRILLDRATLTDGDSLSAADALDLGEYSSLGLVMTVHEAGDGSSPMLVVEQAIINEDGGYVAFDPAVEIPLDASATLSFPSLALLRWLRWRVSGTLSSPAVVTLALIARS